MESLNLKSYLENLKSRKKEKTAKNRLAELVEPFYIEWSWQDDTFFGDMTAIWIALRRYMKWHTDDQLLKLMEWTKGKNVYPRSVISILNKK